MPINEDQLLEKIRRLPPEKQQKGVDFIEQTEQQTGTTKPRRRVGGALEHLGLHISGEEIDEARREMWSNFPRNDF
jgi:hypothetical protein